MNINEKTKCKIGSEFNFIKNKENLLYSTDQSVFKNYLKTKTIFKIKNSN